MTLFTVCLTSSPHQLAGPFLAVFGREALNIMLDDFVFDGSNIESHAPPAGRFASRVISGGKPEALLVWVFDEREMAA